VIAVAAAAPVDRPNLSKDNLGGATPEDWVPLRPPQFYSDNAIELRLGTTVERLSVASREVALADGEMISFDRLLLATGAELYHPFFVGARFLGAILSETPMVAAF
jgi:NADPH-dependent 2,4-dienoyl-CoA reductase/sulfur reductase-like enzyme